LELGNEAFQPGFLCLLSDLKVPFPIATAIVRKA